MTHNLNSAHAHKWGSQWTNDLGIFELSKDQITEMLQAYEKQDYKLLLDEKSCFYPVTLEMDKFIKDNKKVFFRLSTVSPKDVRKKGIIGPILYSTNMEDILDIFIKSERVIEDLESYRDFAIILKKWNNQINMKNEYRCLIFDRKCECIVNTYSFTKLEDSNDSKLIHDFIDKNIHTFPEDNVALDVCIDRENNSVIFIEFNCVDNELDTYDMYDNLSDRAKELLNKEPLNL